MKIKNTIFIAICVLTIITIIISFCILNNFYNSYNVNSENINQETDKKDYIKWIDFNIPQVALQKAMEFDIKSYKSNQKINWIEILSVLATKYGGNWEKYKSSDINNIVKNIKNGKNIEELISNNQKNYKYFFEAYTAVLGGFVGEYQIETSDKTMETKYGLKAYSPIAHGYNFSHYDDFGNSRSFGFKRKHLGNDLLGNVGTPIISVESGYVEHLGWNRYGGWRIGIRSLDKKRYYYYAHLRKDIPFIENIKEGDLILAGDVIGYLGMTGYSDTENINGMTKPHLHFGMQLIFDESQKGGNNEIWIDVYQIVKLLQKHTSPVLRIENSKHFSRKYKFIDPQLNITNGLINN